MSTFRRVHRWIGRRARRDLADHRPGASANTLLEDDVTAIVVEVDDTMRVPTVAGGWLYAAGDLNHACCSPTRASTRRGWPET